MDRYLVILEVSQKQAYIFNSNKLKDNIINSSVIAKVLDPAFIENALKEQGYSDEKNMVYAGGGHTILEFADRNQAAQCVAILTEKVYREFDGLQIFASITQYENEKSVEENLRKLTETLEGKKSRRSAFFHQGSYGIEEIDSSTLDVKEVAEVSDEKKAIENEEYSVEASFYPAGFRPALAFGDLGGSKNESNFIAVVHIDGNGMGKRVEELYKKIGEQDWQDAKKTLRAFSEAIDDDFKSAFKSMTSVIGQNIASGALADLSIKDKRFPIRRVITAGDDICYVAEGRIGIESAAIFIEELSKRINKVDHRTYSACAGIALVHQKYPFYRAYELAEQLCSNAKQFGSMISPDDNGRAISSVDWHIEFGEMGDSLDEIRKNYSSGDGNELTLRPYIVDAPENFMKDDALARNRYAEFRLLMKKLQKKEKVYTTGKLKELRGAMKRGETASYNYLCFNRMEGILSDAKPMHVKLDVSRIGTGDTIQDRVFVKSGIDSKKHCVLFDAVELLDTYLNIERGE